MQNTERKQEYLQGTSDIRNKLIDKKRVYIYVGGVFFETFEETLNRHPDTLLGCKEKRKNYYNERRNCYYFFTQSPISFNSILFYYQSNGILQRPPDVRKREFRKALDFFQIEYDKTQLILIKPKRPKRPPNSLREAIHFNLEYPLYSDTSRILSIVSVTVIAISTCVHCLDTEFVPNMETSDSMWILIFDFIFQLILFFDFSLRFVVAPNKLNYLKSLPGFVDILAFVPGITHFILTFHTVPSWLIRVIGFLRALRILKVFRYSRWVQYLLVCVRLAADRFLQFFFILFIVTFFFASIVFLAENQHGETFFHSIPDTLWFIIVTLTTLGYGDMVVFSNLGKVVVFLTMLCGTVLFVCLPAPLMFWNFLDVYEEEQEEKRERKENERQKRIKENA